MTLDVDALVKTLISRLPNIVKTDFHETYNVVEKSWLMESKEEGDLFSKVSFTFDPQSSLGPNFQLACWPCSLHFPALHVTLKWLPPTEGKVDYLVFLELLFQSYLYEDDAVDWHRFLRSECQRFGVEYLHAKKMADLRQFSSTHQLYRGVGGVEMVVSDFNQVVWLLKKTMDMYLSLLHRRDTSLELDTTPCWEYQQALVQRLCQSDTTFHPITFPPRVLQLPSLRQPPQVEKRTASLMAVQHRPRSTFDEPLLVQALRGVSVPRPPVWLHRQAGRYLPEYRELKGTKNFLELTGDPCLAAEITMQPIRRYQMDAAIIFSDIMTIPIALGLEVLMQPGPFLPDPLKNGADIDRLKYMPEKLNHVYDALKLVRNQLDHEKALIGFCGAPFTLLYYMVRPSNVITDWLEADPKASHRVLTLLSEVAIDYLRNQIHAGADVVQIFESHALDMSLTQFQEFSLPYLLMIAEGVKQVHPHVPLVVFPRGMPHEALSWFRTQNAIDAVSLDSSWDPSTARHLSQNAFTLQGNFPPQAMYLPYEEIRTKVTEMIQNFGRQRYVVNLGHGTLPDMDPEAVRVFVETAQTIRLGSRASPLALAQSQLVIQHLPKLHRYHIVSISTKGDEILDRSIAKIGSKGVFTKELDTALLSNTVDLVQHSLKDMETHPIPGLTLAAMLPRADRRDALVSMHGYTLTTLPMGATLGTSAVRRQAQLLSLRQDLQVMDVRGNIQTRLTKLMQGDYDALVMAMAGLERMHLSHGSLSIVPFPESLFIPAAGQGAIAIQVRSNDLGLLRCVHPLNHGPTWTACHLERDVLRGLQGGCQVPLGVYTDHKDDGTWEVHAQVWDLQGKQNLSVTAPSGIEAANQLLKMGAKELLCSTSHQVDSMTT
ncbi:hypothetical protein HMI54_015576 [Coelomomyces lativittatus]|nr:hypothetical protein HMI55_000627 [Coelomomyces lativittatus]KAJ1512182.1 hypothetical protein HMI56_004405 [Coelomomyces lativittatus]KAJ1512660.1 hypothetical protein HMI54_015576 [Coelomomyces lativittatus]